MEWEEKSTSRILNDTRSIEVDQSSTKETCPDHGRFQKITLDQILTFFEGNTECLNYYISLKTLLSETRHKGHEPYYCDPRATSISQKLKSAKWTPLVVLKPIQVVSEGDGAGFKSKQTALDSLTCSEENDGTEDGADDASKYKPGDMSNEGELKSEDCFVCGIQGCGKKLSSLVSYESHYHTSHSFVCSMCRRVFVSNFLLDVHLQENHDSYFQILSPRIDMFRCLVESCSLKFRTSDLRKDHMVSMHKFPGNFSFHQPIKKKISKKRQPQHEENSSSDVCNMDSVQSVSPSPQEVTMHDCNVANQQHPSHPLRVSLMSDMNIDVDEVAMAKDVSYHEEVRPQPRRGGARGKESKGRGKKVPTTICFGRGSQRAFQLRGRGRGGNWHQLNDGVQTRMDIENVDMSDLLESLDT